MVGARRSVSPWSSRMGVGRKANKRTPEKSTVTKPPGPMEKDHGGDQDSARKEEERISQ